MPPVDSDSAILCKKPVLVDPYQNLILGLLVFFSLGTFHCLDFCKSVEQCI